MFTGCRNPAHTQCSSPSKKIDINSPVTFGPVSKSSALPLMLIMQFPKTPSILYIYCIIYVLYNTDTDESQRFQSPCFMLQQNQGLSGDLISPSSDGSVTLVWLMGSKHHWSRHGFKRASCQVLWLQKTKDKPVILQQTTRLNICLKVYL